MHSRPARCMRSVSTVLVIAAVLAGGCGSEDDGDSKATDAAGAPDTSTFQVTWSPETTVIDEAHVGLVKQIDLAGGTYTLDASGVADLGLAVVPGRILAIFGEGILHIDRVEANGQNLIVHVTPAEFTDAITDGIIEWDHGIGFNPAGVQAVAVGGQLARAVGADGVVKLTFKDGPFDYDIKVTLLDSSAAFDFTITKDLAGEVKAKFTAKGSLERFRSKGAIRIQNRQVQEYRNSVEKLQGNATVAVIVTGSGNDLSYKLPVPVMKIPFVVGFLPVSLNIGAQFVVNAVVPVDGTAQASADFSYDSDLGFAFNGSKVDATAHVGDHTISQAGDTPYAAGANQISANFGVAFPHIELSVGHKLIAEASAWFHPAFLVGGSFTANGTLIPVCMKIETEYLAAAGYKVSVLNGLLQPLDGSKTIFDEKKLLRQSGDCP